MDWVPLEFDNFWMINDPPRIKCDCVPNSMDFHLHENFPEKRTLPSDVYGTINFMYRSTHKFI